MANRFVLNETSYHGHGAIENVVPEALNRGFKKALVCSDASLIKFGVTAKVTDLLDKAGIAYTIYDICEKIFDVIPQPTAKVFNSVPKPLNHITAKLFKKC